MQLKSLDWFLDMKTKQKPQRRLSLIHARCKIHSMIVEQQQQQQQQKDPAKQVCWQSILKDKLLRQ